MPDNPSMERKVLLLPVGMMARVRAYQAAQGIASEVEAVRRLLDRALAMLETPQIVLTRLRAEYEATKDLRAAARNVLATHCLVDTITFLDGEGVEFRMGKLGGCLRTNGQDILESPTPERIA